MENKIAVTFGKEFGSPIGYTNQTSDLIGNLFSTAVIIAGVGLIFLIMLSGYQFISSSGSADAQAKAKARNRLTWAIIGFIIIFASFWIVQILETIVGVNFFTKPSF